MDDMYISGEHCGILELSVQKLSFILSHKILSTTLVCKTLVPISIELEIIGKAMESEVEQENGQTVL